MCATVLVSGRSSAQIPIWGSALNPSPGDHASAYLAGRFSPSPTHSLRIEVCTVVRRHRPGFLGAEVGAVRSRQARTDAAVVSHPPPLSCCDASDRRFGLETNSVRIEGVRGSNPLSSTRTSQVRGQFPASGSWPFCFRVSDLLADRGGMLIETWRPARADGSIEDSIATMSFRAMTLGENLQDHLEVYVQYACKQPASMQPYLKWRIAAGARWQRARRGLLVGGRPEAVGPDAHL
jgi:hypothetical protein